MSNLQNKSSKKPWSTKEDAMLIRLIEEYGSCGSWPKIALHMEWRTGKQCRERYINQLDPNIKKTAWTAEEDSTILRLHEQLGKKWSKFMDLLPGRSDNAIKNRWHVISRDTFEIDSNTTTGAPAVSAASTPMNIPIKSEIKHTVRTKKPLKSAASASKEMKAETVEPVECRQFPAPEERDEILGCELLGLQDGDIDFDLCSFSEGEDGEEDNLSTSPSSTPRTTNELGESNDRIVTTNSFTGDYTYSKTNSVVSSNRDSPIDPQLLNELMMLDETPTTSRKPSLQCMTSHEPSSSDDGHSVTESAPVSPMRVSPKTNLQIQTANSLNDLTMENYYFQKPEGQATDPSGAQSDAVPPPIITKLLGTDNSVVWSLDPNEDLAAALEFLMSATNSPANAGGNGLIPGFACSSGSSKSAGNNYNNSNNTRSMPPIGNRNFSASRSPPTSQYGAGAMLMSSSLDGALSPGPHRARPMSGNLASLTSLLSRSASGSCDAELYPLPPPTAPPSGLFHAPSTGYNFHANIPSGSASASTSSHNTGPGTGPGTGTGVGPSGGINTGTGGGGGLCLQVPFPPHPEHSPMNHTHFSPACPDSKRPRGKNPSYFSW